jgi:hypothetical protein
MDINVKVTLTADPDLLSILQDIAKNLTGNPVQKETTTAPTATTEKKAKKENVNGTQQNAANTVKQTDYTLEMVRTKVKAVSDAGKREEVKTVLAEFGADRVTNLSKEHYPEFVTKLEAL